MKIGSMPERLQHLLFPGQRDWQGTQQWPLFLDQRLRLLMRWIGFAVVEPDAGLAGLFQPRLVALGGKISLVTEVVGQLVRRRGLQTELEGGCLPQGTVPERQRAGRDANSFDSRPPSVSYQGS